MQLPRLVQSGLSGRRSRGSEHPAGQSTSSRPGLRTARTSARGSLRRSSRRPLHLKRRRPGTGSSFLPLCSAKSAWLRWRGANGHMRAAAWRVLCQCHSSHPERHCTGGSLLLGSLCAACSNPQRSTSTQQRPPKNSGQHHISRNRLHRTWPGTFRCRRGCTTPVPHQVDDTLQEREAGRHQIAGSKIQMMARGSCFTGSSITGRMAVRSNVPGMHSIKR